MVSWYKVFLRDKDHGKGAEMIPKTFRIIFVLLLLLLFSGTSVLQGQDPADFQPTAPDDFGDSETFDGDDFGNSDPRDTENLQEDPSLNNNLPATEPVKDLPSTEPVPETEAEKLSHALTLFQNQELNKASDLFYELALYGNTQAMVFYGHIWKEGITPALIDYKEAVKWYRKAAQNKNLEAHFHLAVMYLNGHGVEKNRGMAEDLFTKCEKMVDQEQQKAIIRNTVGEVLDYHDRHPEEIIRVTEDCRLLRKTGY